MNFLLACCRWLLELLSGCRFMWTDRTIYRSFPMREIVCNNSLSAVGAVASLLALGATQTLEGGRPILVIEAIEGQDDHWLVWIGVFSAMSGKEGKL